MADTGLRMNFAALKRADPYAKEIIDSATHVALYTFEENKWEKTNIEGALFVYSRNGEPFHSLVIMNRLNTNNLIEPVLRGIELQLKEPFLLYRNAKCRIYGIWFYDKEECVRVATKLNCLIQDLMKPVGCENMAQNPVYTAAPSNATVDIFTMLSKAQDDFNSNKGIVTTTTKSEMTPAPAPRAPDMTSQSVMDFFAKAGSGAAAQMPAVSALPSPGFFGPRPADPREGPLIMQRLMSNPANTVEHIEKQQRSVTPQEVQNSNGNIVLESAMRQNSGFQLQSTPLDKHMKSIPVMKKIDASDPNGPLENELNLMHITSPKTTSPLATYLNQSQDISNTVSAYNFTPSKIEDVAASYSMSNPMTALQTPALMPPTMFTGSSVGEVQPTPEPLTRNQLLQAFNYLLKHDADFVNKLHEAYVKSFSEKAFSVS